MKAAVSSSCCRQVASAASGVLLRLSCSCNLLASCTKPKVTSAILQNEHQLMWALDVRAHVEGTWRTIEAASALVTVDDLLPGTKYIFRARVGQHPDAQLLHTY